MPSTKRMTPQSATTLFWSPLSLRSRISATSTIGVGMAILSMLLHRHEKIVGCNAPRRQALLIDVTAECLPCRTIGLQTIRPKILAEYAPRFLDMVDQPGQRN